MKVSKYHVLLKWEADDEVYTVWAPSTFRMPTLGSCFPIARATAIPKIAFLSIASVLWEALDPVEDATNMSFPLPGVTTRPMVVTPIGKG